MTNSGAPDVKWVRAEDPTYALPPLPDLRSAEGEKRNTQLVVNLLAVGCALLVVFDVLLLAWNL